MQLQSLHSSVGKVGMRKCLKLSMHITQQYRNPTNILSFEAMFGRIAKLPVDINLALDYNPDEKLLQYMNAEDPPDKEKETRKLMEDQISKKPNKNFDPARTWRWGMLQGWCNSTEKGFHKGKASWGEVGLSLGGCICYNCSSWKMSL